MSEADWTFLSDGLAAPDVARGVSQGFTPPNGGSNFVFGYKSKTNNAGTVAKAGNASNFYPVAAGAGASVRGAIQRNGDQDCSIMLFAALDAASVLGNGYLLGLTQDEEPSHIVLAKGSPNNGLKIAGTNLLAQSVETIAKGSWVHLRLDVLVQPHGDVHLQVFQNDLDTNPVTSPVWEAISGMAEVIDDRLGVNTGSEPYKDGGYVGVAYRTDAIGRWAIHDHMEIGRQV